MGNYIFWTFMLAVLAVLSVGIAVFVRAYANGTTASALFFKPRSDRRLEVVEHANIDGRRKLLLIRRDDVEHLLMTGGPVDVVVETGIPSRAQIRRRDDAAATGYTATAGDIRKEQRAGRSRYRHAGALRSGVQCDWFCVAEVGHRELAKIERPHRAGEHAGASFGF